MAPNKKKKKPVGNPARGFATVSVASKVRDLTSNDPVNVASGHDSPLTGKNNAQPQVVASLRGSSSNSDVKSIEKMSPEEFEAHLADADIQSLLEHHSATCKSEVARQVSRLYAERRQLRSQAYKVNTRVWLDDETIDRVLIASDEAPVARITPREPLETKRVLDLWILQRVLLGLKFKRTSDVLRHVVYLALQRRVQTDTGLVWGLAEAFQWYCMQAPADQLPDYDTVHQEGTAVQQSRPAHFNDDNEELSEHHEQELPHKEIDTDLTSQSEEISADEDIEPEALIPTYLEAKTRLWRLSQIGQPRESNANLRKLRNRIAGIERDVLFDQEHADVQWRELEMELQIEAGRKHKEAAVLEQTNIPGHTIETLSFPEDTEDESSLLGNVFIEPGDDLQSQSITDQPGETVRLVDFGKWSGLGPRQLLEQTCRSIDEQVKISLSLLSQPTYSVRHRIELIWSEPRLPDPLARQSLPNEIKETIHSRRWTVEMQRVAASSTDQSIAYITTLALFLVMAEGGQEQQSIVRLPTVWRNEFANLTSRRKQLVVENEKAEIRELQELIKEKENQLLSEWVSSPAMTQEGEKPVAVTDTNPQLRRPKSDPANVSNDWAQRVASLRYQQMQPIREKLPIFQHKDLILKTVAAYPLTIVCAETGSGKSTQTASYILERQLSRGNDCRIVVTQPRRISAISLARRVSVELGEGRNDLGSPRSLVGYAIRLESNTSSSTRLTFVTTGVLLRMLESSPDLEQLDYLLLDEVHERTMEMDLLFIALRRVCQRRRNLKVILMSATIDAQKFSDYFGNAPVLDIPGRTFPVDVRFLEDALEETNDIEATLNTRDDADVGLEQDGESRTSSPSAEAALESYSGMTRRRLRNLDEYRINYDLITQLVIAVATKSHLKKYSSAILIFMPGMGEIRRLHSALLAIDSVRLEWDIYLLHSAFSTEELEQAFAIPAPGRRKIVIATNIAETGITIPDVTAVIDTCKEKIMRFDERRQVSKLTEGFISRTSAKQRRGRAARVQEGLCFHLVTRHRHDHQLLEQQIPEIGRLSLQESILMVKLWDLGSIESTFQEAIDPPNRKNVFRAIERLKDAGALNKKDDLTALGLRIARLPLDVAFAKLAVLASIFGCVEPALGIISLLTSKSVFVDRTRLDSRKAWSGADSDILTSFNAFEGWRKAKIAGKSTEFCRKNGLSEHNLVAVEEQMAQLMVYLVDAGLVVLDAEEKGELNRARVHSSKSKGYYRTPARYNRPVNDDLLLCIIAMAFYPRILTREGRGWRNVYTNQQVSLRKESVNYASSKPPKWLSFSETMQTTAGSLSIAESSRIPDVALAVLLGDADVRMFSGVLSLDNGKIKVAVRRWRETLALRLMRQAVKEMLERRYRRMESPSDERDLFWVEMLRGLSSP